MKKKLIWLSGMFLGAAAVGLGCGGDPGTSSAGLDPGAAEDPGAALTAMTALTSSATCSQDGESSTRFYVPPPGAAALAQIKTLAHSGHLRDALHLALMEATPQAAWFDGGTPDEVKAAVHDTMVRAAREHRVPVLVAYNVPFRDCAQYSAGGATDTAAYDAWIDGFAQGIGDKKAVVILEPDGLGIIPYLTSWCQPTVTDASGNPVVAPGASAAERYAQMNHAVDSLASSAPAAAVYLDGTHSSFLSVADAASRLVQAGVQRAKGFFLDVSNYQPTPQLTKYGTWIAKCIYYANNPAEGGWRVGHYDYCASQYYPATPGDFSTWGLTDDWYAANVDTAANPPTGPEVLAHFVLDTSRNGQGPLDTTPFAAPPYSQPAGVIAGLNGGNWCNPPGAGAGLRPTASTGVPLLDAYLWIKTPGQSDGSCDIAGGARAWDYTIYNPWALTAGDAQNHFDPLWGLVDPAAGVWFPEQALQLATRANPPLVP